VHSDQLAVMALALLSTSGDNEFGHSFENIGLFGEGGLLEVFLKDEDETVVLHGFPQDPPSSMEVTFPLIPYHILPHIFRLLIWLQSIRANGKTFLPCD
jgi:hypothetical protein